MTRTYCIFSANYLPNLGGVERYTYNIAKKIIEKGNKVVVVTSNTFHLPFHEIIDNIEIYRLPCFNLLNGRFPVLKLNKEFFFIYKKLRSITFDKVIVNTRFYIHSLFGVRFATRHKIKPIVIEHGTNHFTVNNKVWDFLGHIYEHFITFFIKKYCTDFYGVSDACLQWLKHFNIDGRGILYNAIDIDHINELFMKPICDYRKILNIDSEAIVITYTGRLVKEKGILKLIESFKNVNKKFSNTYLIIAGDGDLYNDINHIDSEHIIALGRIDFEKIVALLKVTDIFCLPTDYPEGFPTSVLEAASCKCFIITTLSGGSKELIINRDYGIILKYNTVDELSESLENAITDVKYRKEAVDLTYNRVIHNFNWDIVSEKIMNL